MEGKVEVPDPSLRHRGCPVNKLNRFRVNQPFLNICSVLEEVNSFIM